MSARASSGVALQPVASVADMARPGLFDSDQEWDEFLADLYASRRAGLA